MSIILDTVSCGALTNIDSMIPKTISTIVSLIMVIIPIVLVIFGMLDLGKAVASQKEEEIKKGQKTLFARVIQAVIVFFVVALVRLVMYIVGGNEESNPYWNCFDCFINGEEFCKGNK